MAWTPEEVINAARDIHPSFDERQTPDAAARRAVDRYDEKLFQRILDIEPEEFLSTHEISFPLADFEAGYDGLPDFVSHLGGEVYFQDSSFQENLNIVPHRSRHAPGHPNAAYFQDGDLFFVGRKQDWGDVDKVVFFYTAPRTPLAALDTESALPDTVKPAVVEKLALFMASRGPNGMGEDPVPISLTVEEWRETEANCLASVAGKTRGTETTVREVW